MVQLSCQAWFVASSAGLVLFCLGADHVIFRWEDKWMKLRNGAALRAVSDSLVHGLVGGWSWVNVLLLTEGGGEGVTWTIRILQVVLCVGMATAIDLDHMIEARSFSIKDALSLPKRPFAHNTTLIPILTLLLYLLVYVSPSCRNHPFMSALPLMFLISTLSHHLRDADRRGIWFAPFLSTPPIPLKFYTLFIILLPLATAAPRLLPLAFKAIVDIRALKGSTERDISMA